LIAKGVCEVIEDINFAVAYRFSRREQNRFRFRLPRYLRSLKSYCGGVKTALKGI
jgi:hypothetical protein